MKKLLLICLLLCFSAVSAWSADNDVMTREMLEELALSGDAEAGFILGGQYYFGTGVPQSYDTALRWFSLAAGQNYDLAQFMLGNMYARGQGVSQSNDKAAEWYRKSAAQGNGAAQLALTMLSMQDVGSNMSAARLYMLFKLAGQSDDEETAQAGELLLGLFSLLMSDEELAQGRQLADDWQRKTAITGE